MALQGQESGQLLLERVRELRQESFHADTAQLEEISGFLNSHHSETAKDSSHLILENYPDWWVAGKVGGRRAPPGLYFEQGSQEEEELYKYAAILFGMGIPLTLAERRSPTFRLFQDIDIWGSADESMPVEQLISPESCFITLLGKAIGEVFPPSASGSGNNFLDASIYDASGVSQTKGLRKASVRIVWPAITVDADRALRFRDLLISRLQTAGGAESGGPVADLEGRLRRFAAQNSWHGVLGDASYGQRAVVRLPLNDRVSPLPLRSPEGRPFQAVGVLRFAFSGEEDKKKNQMKVEWLCRQGELEVADWMKIGSVRQNEKASLTEWIVPTLPVGPMLTGLGRGARVKVRTQGGSDGGGGLRMAGAMAQRTTPLERAGQIVEVHRRFSANWDMQSFCDKMEKQCGQSTIQDNGVVTWRNPTNDARIEMHEEDRKITVVGKPNQVRSLIVFVSQFTEACPGLVQSNPNTASNPRSSNGYNNAPGSAFAPAGQTNADESTQESTANADKAADSGPAVGQLRVAHMEFVAEGAGELSLQVDETARVTYDEPGAENESRWVYGRSEKSGECGWFPLDHTRAVEEPEERET
jgi:hypothetical protein